MKKTRNKRFALKGISFALILLLAFSIFNITVAFADEGNTDVIDTEAAIVEEVILDQEEVLPEEAEDVVLPEEDIEEPAEAPKEEKTPAQPVALNEEPCAHKAVCDNPDMCVICGKEGLKPEEIAELVHAYVYCYDTTVCGNCGETIVNDNYEDLLHDTNEHARYQKAKGGHYATCFCGEVKNPDKEKHSVSCTNPDLSACELCGAQNVNVEIRHSGEQLHTSRDYHWRECTACGELTMPKLEHYTSCLDPDGPCDFCGLPHDEINLLDKYYGFHCNALTEVVKENGIYYHREKCLDCKKVYLKHDTIYFEEFGDAKTHLVKCKCGLQFDDAKHEIGIVGKKDASCTEDGYTGDKACELCGQIFKEGKNVKALGHNFVNGKCTRCGLMEKVPKTGDDKNAGIWIVVAMFAALGLAMCGIKILKRK